MAGDNTFREKVWTLYLEGNSITEAAQVLGAKYNLIKKYYDEFTIASAVTKEKEKTDIIIQIKTIEKVLFEKIKQHQLNPNKVTTKEVQLIQNVYCQFLL
jgi:hypothetical protein